MTRLALLLALPLVACGDDAVATGSATTTGPGTSSTGDTSGTVPTTGEPTTGAAASTSGSDSATGTTGTTDTTQGVDATTSSTTDSSSTTDASSTSTTTDTSSSSTTDASSSSTTDASSSSSTTDESTGEVGVLPMPAGICNQGDLTSFVEPMAQAEELHIVAVYQATGNALTVTINRTDIPITLILNSYEPVAYTLVLAPGVLLEHVILDGYNHHTVQGEGAAMVTDMSGNFDYLAACGYYWPENDGGCDTPGLVMGAEALTGLELAAFVGCYEGSSFTID